MDVKARVDVRSERKDGRVDRQMDRQPDGQTENQTPMSHTAKAGVTKDGNKMVVNPIP